MAKTTTGQLNDMLSGEAPLVDAQGNVLSPAKAKITPTAGSPLDTATIVRGRNGEILLGGALIRNPNENKDIETSRIGDYVYDSKGNAQIVPGSYRDLANKYVVRTGESAYKGLGVYDYATALSKGIAAAFGLPTDSSSVPSMLGTYTVGQIASGIPAGKGIWSLLNVGKSIVDAETQARRKYESQEIDYDIALDFTTDSDGNVVATPKYEKMATAGSGSGSEILSATNIDDSSVELTNDNQLDIKVSDAFADSARFAEVLEFLRENYKGLTKKQAERVIDEDTGQTLIQAIEQDIKSAESSFYYSARAIKAFKEITPAASDDALNQATWTQLAGYVSDDSLSNMSIVVYNEANEREEVNAKEFLDSIKNKSKAERNSYMNSLGFRIQSEDTSDDEKVILQAQANALYSVSEKDGAYKGMYKKDFLDSLGDVPVPVFTQMTLGELFAEPFGSYTNLDAFETNEAWAGLFQIADTFAEALAISKLTNGIEALGRKGVEALSKGVLSGTKIGTALSKINTFAPQDTRFLLPGVELSPEMAAANVMSAAPLYQTTEASLRGLGSWLGKTGVQTGMQLAADAAVEGLRYGAYEAYGKGDRFNFLDELQADLLFDALMTYGPRNYVTRAEKTKLKVFDADERVEEVDEDGRLTGGTFTLPGTRVVEQTADDVARIHAERIDKLTDSDLAIKTQELLFDRNAAFGKLAVEVRRTVSGDNYLYRKILRMGNDIRSLTQDVHSRFNQIYSADLNDFMSRLSDVAPKIRDWTQADRDYLNATVQSYRFSKIHEGDETAQKEISDFYSKALDGVSEERKAQLNELLTAGRKLASDVLTFYKDNDIISETAKREIENRPEYVGGMFFPVWQKSKRISGGEISQERPVFKSIFAKDELVAVKDLEDPLVTLSQYLQNAARNVAINERALAIQEAASVPGMKMHLVSDTSGSLSDVENLKELSNEFAKQYDALKKKVYSESPSREEWQKVNDDLVLKSDSMKMTGRLKEIDDELGELGGQLRETREEKLVDPLRSAQKVSGANVDKKTQEKNLAKIPEDVVTAWYDGGNLEAREELAEKALRDPEIRNAGLSAMYDAWSEWNEDSGGKEVSYEDWLVTPLLLTRYGEMETGEGLNYTSYSLLPDGQPQRGLEKSVILVRPIDTLGILNTRSYVAEQEVILPINAAVLSMEGQGERLVGGLQRLDGTERGRAFNDYTTFERVVEGQDLQKLPKEDRRNLLRALAKKTVTIYSNEKIKQGSEVSLSKGEYGTAHKKEVGIDEVVWNGKRGQYVGVADEKIPEEAQRTLDLETKAAELNQERLFIIDQIKDSLEELMEKAQKLSKSSVKLDIKTYLNTTATNNLKKARMQNKSTAQVQIAISDAVEKANPFVDPDVELQARAEDAAIAFRKRINKRLKMKKKTVGDKLNEMADKVADYIEEKVMGAKAEVKVIDDAEATRILNSSGDPHTIRYMLDGVEQRMVLTGPGSERLVAEFYAPEYWQPSGFWRNLAKKTIDVGGKMATARRVLTSSMDIGRVLPNLARDWSRGIVASHGQILLSPDMIRDWALAQGEASPERAKIVQDGLDLVRESIDRSTLTESLEVPKKNRAKSMVRAANSPDGNAFTRYIYDRAESPVKVLSSLQDAGESFTRLRATEVAYYRALGECFSRGMSDTEAIKRATEAAYMAGRETTTNFFRRGKLIAAIARNVPYFSQNFAALESFKYSFLDNPIGVARALQDTTFAYTALIAIALSNEESRKKYYLLTEYDRANNIIIPLANDLIITIPLDETMAAFLTPWRRTVETMAGVDPEAFYMTFLETFEALSPFDLEGFSEGDKFNLARGLEKLGSQMIPTWAQPLIEAYTGRDLYYGSTLRVTQEDIGERTGNWNATPGQLTTSSKNSQALAVVSEHTGIPQWVLQNMLSEYGGSIGQYALNVIDKLSGATEEAQGGKEWSDSIYKPFTGSDSNQVSQAFFNGANQLKSEKAKLQKELKTIRTQLLAATGEEKAALQQKRQKKINDYGTRVSDFLNQYLSAYEITGGLTKSQANQIWYLYKIYDDNANENMYDVLSTGEYYSNKQKTYNNRRATGLAAESGLDSFVDPAVVKADSLVKSASDPTSNYADTYGRQAHLNSIYGDATRSAYRLEAALKDAGLARNEMFDQYNAAKTKAEKKAIKAEWNTRVLRAIAPAVEEMSPEVVLSSSDALDLLEKWLFDLTPYNRKQYLTKIFGGQ